MKEQLLQLKQDIVDISNDLTANLADKGVEATGTLSELVNQVKDIKGGGNPLEEIGWNLAEQPFLNDAIDYAKEILVNPKSNYQNDKQLVIFPKVNEVNTGIISGWFRDSSLTLFPEGIKVYGTLDYLFQNTPIIYADITNFILQGSISSMFNSCNALQSVKLPENFGETVTSLDSLFNKCERLKSPITITVNDRITSLYNTFNNCKSIPYITIKGDCSKITNTQYAFMCSNLIELTLPDSFIIDTSYIFYVTMSKLRRINGSIIYKYKTTSSYSTWIWSYYQNNATRYVVFKDLGSMKDSTAMNMTSSRVWGIANDEVPDARQSLIDSLITYSFDRAAAGYSTMSLELYKDVKALLTDEEIAQITAKGYTLI